MALPHLAPPMPTPLMHQSHVGCSKLRLSSIIAVARSFGPHAVVSRWSWASPVYIIRIARRLGPRHCQPLGARALPCRHGRPELEHRRIQHLRHELGELLLLVCLDQWRGAAAGCVLQLLGTVLAWRKQKEKAASSHGSAGRMELHPREKGRVMLIGEVQEGALLQFGEGASWWFGLDFWVEGSTAWT